MTDNRGEGPVLVVSHDVVGQKMAGPGIRYHHLARVLAAEMPVVLAAPAGSDALTGAPYHLLPYASAEDPVLQSAAAGARCILAPAIWLARATWLLASATPIVVDGYDPVHAEALYLTQEDTSGYLALLTQACLAGDLFLCASERQRDWWLGALESLGRVNIHTFKDDPSLRRLVDLVPFGLPAEPPARRGPVLRGVWPGIGTDDKIILWGGGLWPWLDPLTAIRAVGQLAGASGDLRLAFPGTRHPNPEMASIPTHTGEARRLAADLGLLDRQVFFGDWVPHELWQSALLECDVALVLHGAETLESRLAFRSRVLEYIWAGLPTVCTVGDATSDLIAARNLGLVVPPGDVDAVAGAINRLLDEPRGKRRSAFAAARRDLSWESAATALTAFCRRPWRAADKVVPGVQPGNPYYRQQIATLDWLTAEVGRLGASEAHYRDLATALENRRVVRLANRWHALRRRLAPRPPAQR